MRFDISIRKIVQCSTGTLRGGGYKCRLDLILADDEKGLWNNVSSHLLWINQIIKTTSVALDDSGDVLCKCGMVKRFGSGKRMLGGTETEVNEFPWMAGITSRGRVFCGGSVINSFWVITAAHCVITYKGILHEQRHAANLAPEV